MRKGRNWEEDVRSKLYPYLLLLLIRDQIQLRSYYKQFANAGKEKTRLLAK
jgi:hypothetical protein